MLNNLSCGIWGVPKFWFDDDPNPQLYNRQLIFLRQSYNKMLAERDLHPSDHDPKPNANAISLQFLDLNCSYVSSVMWDDLSKLHHLLSLNAYWGVDIKDEQWALLANFRALQVFKYQPDGLEDLPAQSTFKSMIGDSVIPHLLNCSELTSLALESMDLNMQQVANIVNQLIKLKSLSLEKLNLDSVKPLANAKSLERLKLLSCQLAVQQQAPSDSDRLMNVEAVASSFSAAVSEGQPPVLPSRKSRCFRVELPSMPFLQQLILFDITQRSKEEVAPLNKALLLRMPSLQLKNFHQNLLNSGSVVAPDISADLGPCAFNWDG